jgi:hypothetical protein
MWPKEKKDKDKDKDKDVSIDTKRLDWMLAHLGANADQLPDHCFISWWQESRYLIARGKDYRECIDIALAGKAEKWM